MTSDPITQYLHDFATICPVASLFGTDDYESYFVLAVAADAAPVTMPGVAEAFDAHIGAADERQRVYVTLEGLQAALHTPAGSLQRRVQQDWRDTALGKQRVILMISYISLAGVTDVMGYLADLIRSRDLALFSIPLLANSPRT